MYEQQSLNEWIKKKNVVWHLTCDLYICIHIWMFINVKLCFAVCSYQLTVPIKSFAQIITVNSAYYKVISIGTEE